jgi:hypothetical protein
MKKLILSTFTFILFSISITAQEDNYFQQEVNFTINVSLDDEKHMLKGNVDIEYINNSPDELSFIWFHLWPNGYANNETELAQEKFHLSGQNTYFTDEESRGYIDSLYFTSNSNKLTWELHPQHIDICKVMLPDPLKPGESIAISTPFRVKVPDADISRLGHSGQAYSITQWYPKPAVYDMNGWHEMPYRDMGEFYSEFGKFDVFITVPENYRVAATGNLQNEEEKQWLDSLASLELNNHVFDPNPPSSTKTKTLHFSQDNIHDFAWFTNKYYHVRKDEVKLESGKTIQTWAFFSDKSKGRWNRATSYINDAVYYYSKWNGDYPYENCTAVEGPLSAGGGMEYPTITVIGNFENDYRLEQVIMHEVGHNWFYGFLASNERVYPYMDEGVNSANEARYMETKYPNLILSETINVPGFLIRLGEIDKIPYSHSNELAYLLNEKRNYSQVINERSEYYTQMNYGVMVYMKAAFVFNHLRHYMGDEAYDRAFHNYYKNFLFKHPYPADLQQVLEAETEKNLDWFFTDMLSTTKRADYAILKVDGNKVLLKNTGEINSPVLVQTASNEQIVSEQWIDGFEGENWLELDSENFDKVYIDKNQITYDDNRHNNIYDVEATLPKFEPLKFKFLSGIDHAQSTEIFYLPVFGYTVAGGALPGLLLHNTNIFPKKFEYQIMPMYSAGTQNLSGTAKFNLYVPFKAGFIRNMNNTSVLMQYAGVNDNKIQKIQNTFHVEFRDELSNDHEYHLYFKNLFASDFKEMLNGDKHPSLEYYGDVQFVYENIDKIHPFSLKSGTKFSEEFVKQRFELKANYTFTNGRKIHFRSFSEANLQNKRTHITTAIPVSGARGLSDYTYDETFLNRFDTRYTTYNVFLNNGSGLRPLAADKDQFADQWLSAVNIHYELTNLIRPYAHAAWYDFYGITESSYEVGVRLGITNLAEVYFPLWSERHLQDDIYDDYFSHVRFMINLNGFNIFNLLKQLPY